MMEKYEMGSLAGSTLFKCDNEPLKSYCTSQEDKL